MRLETARDRLWEKLSLLAILVEGEFVMAAASVTTPSVLQAERLAIAAEEIACLAEDVRAQCLEFLVRFRPIAIDLHVVTTALACCSDLLAAAAAINGFTMLSTFVDPWTNTNFIPAFEQLVWSVQMLVGVAVDAIGSLDGTCFTAIREMHDHVIALREQLSAEVAAAAGQSPSAVERLIAAADVACYLEKVAAMFTACVRGVSRVGAVDIQV